MVQTPHYLTRRGASDGSAHLEDELLSERGTHGRRKDYDGSIWHIHSYFLCILNVSKVAVAEPTQYPRFRWTRGKMRGSQWLRGAVQSVRYPFERAEIKADNCLVRKLARGYHEHSLSLSLLDWSHLKEISNLETAFISSSLFLNYVTTLKSAWCKTLLPDRHFGGISLVRTEKRVIVCMCRI